jgi:hypothetical protein
MTQLPAIPSRRETWARRIGISAALIAGGIYLLIGLDTLSVGTSTTEPTTDLLSFGVAMGLFSLASAMGLYVAHARRWLAALAAIQLVPLIGYVALSAYREPAFEPWGLLVKAMQLVVLVAAAVLAVWAHPAARPSMAHPKGAPA